MRAPVDHDLAYVPIQRSGDNVNFGEVFTRRWVVELILDQCRYRSTDDLTSLTVVEPAVGEGAFLGPIIERLLAARAKYSPDAGWDQLSRCIVGRDLQEVHVETCRLLASALLEAAGCPAGTAAKLAREWISVGDFLLDDLDGVHADLVVGNPPYIRIEDLDPALLAAYRKSCATMGGRADAFIGFYERGLDLLAQEGRLAFICADRWMRNQYGRRLREKILSEGFAVDACIVMHDVDAFAEEVSAYPAITVLRRGKQGLVLAADTTAAFNAKAALDFTAWADAPSGQRLRSRAIDAARLPHWHTTAESWPEGSPETVAWLEQLNDTMPLLESLETGTRISIGVATGADAVYVTKDSDAVEPERLLPLAMSADIKSGEYSWTGHYLVNPWDEDGLVDLDSWPRFATYLKRNEHALRQRSIGKRNPTKWFRTIDRVAFALTSKPKLLLEDMKRLPNPVLEPGGRYPHHNLYYIVSEKWDLEVLGGLLLSDVIERQISAYCVKMRGKTLRFQAQYLRRVRIPYLTTIPAEVQEALKVAFRERDRVEATRAALAAFGMERLPE